MKSGRGHGLALGLNIHVLFGFNGLMQALRQSPASHRAARMLIDQNNLTVLNNVFNVSLEQVVRAQCRIYVVQQVKIARGVQRIVRRQQILIDQHCFDELMPFLRELHGALFFVDYKVPIFRLFVGANRKLRNELVDFAIEL